MIATGLLSARPVEGKGFGLFANDDIPRETLIESSPLIVIPKSQNEKILESVLGNYVFDSCYNKGQILLCLGFGSLFNHSKNNNCDPWQTPGRMMQFWTNRKVLAGEELTIKYNADRYLWFTPKEE